MTAKREPVEVRTDDGKLTVVVVGGPKPYVWIGEGSRYIDSVSLSVITKALDSMPPRRPRTQTGSAP